MILAEPEPETRPGCWVEAACEVLAIVQGPDGIVHEETRRPQESQRRRGLRRFTRRCIRRSKRGCAYCAHLGLRIRFGIRCTGAGLARIPHISAEPSTRRGHLHGDYVNPTAMRNRQQELAGYELHVDQFLDRITFDYGLVLLGWSVTYDPALVRALSRSPRRIYTSYWIEPKDLSELAQGLRSALGAIKVS
jgi:hypothetical protein